MIGKWYQKSYEHEIERVKFPKELNDLAFLEI